MSDATEDPDLLAAEYMLGVLSSDEMADVRRRGETEPSLLASIAAWEIRLAPLAELAPAVAPPPELWERLSTATAAANSNVPMTARAGPLGRVGFWRATTAAALALAAALAALAYLPRAAPPARIAALAPLGGPATAFVAELRGDGTLLVSAIAPAPVPAGRDLELWVLPRGGQRPASLGTLPPAGRPITVVADRVPEGAQLLVSLEPAGGSPTGQPTGAVLYGGVVTGR